MWRLKVLTKIILSRLPFGYSLWQKLGLFRHGQMDSSDYALKVFDSHVKRANLEGQLEGKVILELGPGDSISTSIIAAAYGAKSILVDAGDFMKRDVSTYKDLSESLAQQNFKVPVITSDMNFKDVLKVSQSDYFTDGLNSLRSIPSNSVDFIFSQAVLEHLRRHEFLDIMTELRRILKPTGISSHQVDLKDHLGGALNNLTFTEKNWESDFFVKSGFYTNRIQFVDMVKMFKKAAFNVNITHINKWEKLPTSRSQMNHIFQKYTDDELLISSFDVVLS
jgi:predicted SAM-dependent methyltransferase